MTIPINFKIHIMKKNIFSIITAIAIMMFSACTSDDLVNNHESDDYVTVRFFVSGVNISQTMTRANTLQDAFSKLDLVLYKVNEDGSYTKYKECTQESSSTTFGIVNLENVKCGTYKLVALGHNDNEHPNMSDPTNIAFSKYVDIYGHTADITISKTATNNVEVPFVHKSTKISFDFNGYIPDEVQKIQFSIDGASNVYNAITGYASTTTTRVAAINISQEQRSNGKLTTSTYTLLKQEELNSENSYVNITIAGLDATNNVIDPKTYSKIPLKIGYTTTFSGVFFDYSNLSFSFSVNADWTDLSTINM